MNTNPTLKDIESDIESTQRKLTQLQALHAFVSTNLAIFTPSVSTSAFATEITIWNPSRCIEVIAKLWGQNDWLRVAFDKGTVNWERKFGDITITLHGMEKCPPTLVPLNAWPIMLENSTEELA